MSDSLLDAALRYAGCGWPVMPCREKRPLLKHGLHDATTDRGTIERWFSRIWPGAAQIAVVTGRASGVVVLDTDGDDGADALHEIQRAHEPLPRTATVKTPRGEHLYFKHPGVETPNSAGRLGPGLDIRGDGGYVLAPPSIGADSRSYVADERAPLAPMPAWLLTLARPLSTPGKPSPPERWVAMLAGGIREKERNTSLTALVGHLLAKDVDARLARELALLVGRHRCRPALPDAEVDAIVESIARRELAKRGRLR